MLRACRALGAEAVVAYSEADRESLPVGLADEAICIGPPDAQRSYLSAPAVISAALVTGCDAIHPGYGFLSEDEGFAEVVAAHGMTFIGPPANVLERFASKAGTRQLLGAHGLPTIPGSEGMLRDDMHALAEAERIGYPVLVKPSAGGGGKGMRMVRTSRELESVLQGLPAARRRPRSATTRCISRSGSTRTATSKSRSPSTATATASTSGSATARSSGATRRSSRRPRHRRCPTPLEPT